MAKTASPRDPPRRARPRRGRARDTRLAVIRAVADLGRRGRSADHAGRRDGGRRRALDALPPVRQPRRPAARGPGPRARPGGRRPSSARWARRRPSWPRSGTSCTPSSRPARNGPRHGDRTAGRRVRRASGRGARAGDRTARRRRRPRGAGAPVARRGDRRFRRLVPARRLAQPARHHGDGRADPADDHRTARPRAARRGRRRRPRDDQRRGAPGAGPRRRRARQSRRRPPGGLYEDGSSASPVSHPLPVALAAGQSQAGVRGHTAPDGELHSYAIEVRPLRTAPDDRSDGFVAIFTEVTEH
jgi:hypothetical protein